MLILNNQEWDNQPSSALTNIPYLSDRDAGLSAGPLAIVALGASAIGLLDWWSNKMNHTYEDDLDVITGYANYNEWKAQGEPGYYWSWENRFSLEFVRNVLNGYMNTVLADEKVPEYSAYKEENKKAVIKALQTFLPYTAKDLERILDATNYAVGDGKAILTCLLLPRTAAKNIAKLKNPDQVVQQTALHNEQRDKTFIEELEGLTKSIGKTVAVVGAVLGGIYLGVLWFQNRARTTGQQKSLART